MLAVYRRLKFDNPDGGAWKQGWEVTYDRAAVSRSPQLRVFVVPHSHNDPGWKKTFEDYFRSETKSILDNALVKLPVDPRRKFIWAETSYLSIWWSQATPSQREKMVALVKRGQLEIGQKIDLTIDYKCDDEKKKTFKLWRRRGIIAQLKTPGFKKCRTLTFSKHLFIRKLKKTILRGLSILNPNFSEFAFFGK
jgi:hypothetical protein